MLLDGARAAAVGGPQVLLPIGPRNVAPAGQGQEQSLVKENEPNQDEQRVTDAPRILTATVSVVGDGGLDAAGPCIAVVRWGSGNGGHLTAEVDVPIAAGIAGIFSGGLIFSVMGDYLEISARNDSNVTPRQGDDPIGLNVGRMLATASVAVGPRGGNRPVTRTIYGVNGNGGLVGADFVAIPIPPFARTFRVFRSDSLAVRVLQRSATIAAVDGPYAIAATVPSPVFPVLGDGIFVEVSNPAAAGTAPIDVVGIIFELGF
jgi:hypothetical protein